MRADQDETADVVVVGWGVAGAAAAIEAVTQGARVVLLERFDGGGASALSGGVVYAGGGTPYQKTAGVEDTPENMFAYLAMETRGVVSDATLRRFCEESVANLAWLEAQGVHFDARLTPFKTSYPPPEDYLYYSGNEPAEPYCSHARPAPRGHRVKAAAPPPGVPSRRQPRDPGAPGRILFQHLAESTRTHGVDVRTQARVERLVAGGDGRVVGVEYATFPKRDRARRALHHWLWRRGYKMNMYLPPVAALLNRLLYATERSAGRRVRIRARGGVVLAAGGFIFDRELVRRVAPDYVGTRPVGSIGDSGDGLRLGQSAGGSVARLGQISAWRFLAPPESFIRGVLVGPAGTRVCNELLYGAHVGRHIVERAAGRAWLVMDHDVFRRARAEVGAQSPAWMRPILGCVFSPLGHASAPTVAGLAAKLGVDPAGLVATLDAYNAAASAGRPDPLGKAADLRQPLLRPPFYAVDFSIKGPFFSPCAAMTLGGLVVDEESGLVKREDGRRIDGLYAAGRSAVGVCSENYLSGLSIADCVFSGRRAGRHAAATAAATVSGA